MENNKLRKRSEYLHIKSVGKKFRPVNWLLLNYIKANKEGLIFGVTVSTKVGTAVIRNKLKRWCREYFRSQIVQNQNTKVVVNVVFIPMPGEFYKRLQFSEFKIAMDLGIKSIKKFS